VAIPDLSDPLGDLHRGAADNLRLVVDTNQNAASGGVCKGADLSGQADSIRHLPLEFKRFGFAVQDESLPIVPADIDEDAGIQSSVRVVKPLIDHVAFRTAKVRDDQEARVSSGFEGRRAITERKVALTLPPLYIFVVTLPVIASSPSEASTVTVTAELEIRTPFTLAR
jgi:hypothetical protein